MSVKDIIELANKAKPKTLILTHFFSDLKGSEIKKRIESAYTGDVICAYQGMVFNL
jgi:ribonuclease BN (tRNA processing enzyme)